MKYSCDQCEYDATGQNSLRRHKKAIHKDNRANFNSHTKAKHSKEVKEQSISTIPNQKLNVRIEEQNFSGYFRAQNEVRSVESVSSETLQIEDCTESVYVDIVPTLQLAENEVKQEADDPLEISVDRPPARNCCMLALLLHFCMYTVRFMLYTVHNMLHCIL